MCVEISEGRVTNYVLSTLSAVLLLLLLFSTSENVAFLLDRLLFYFYIFFVITPRCVVYLYLILYF